MALSRTQEKELTRLKGAASDLWEDQRDVIERASRIVKEAGHHAAEVGRHDVAPRVQDALDHVRPGIDAARERVSHDVAPAVSSALASAVAVLDAARDPQVRKALTRAGKRGTSLVSKAAQHKSGGGPGKYILIGLGVVAVAGIAYAAWQTLRADDELWVSDDEDDAQNDSQTEAL